MTALYWIIGILAVLIVPTLFKIKVEILYAGAFALHIRYLFLNIKIPPEPDPKKEARRAEKEKKRKLKKKSEHKRKKQKPAPPEDEKSFREKVRGVLGLLEDVFGFSKRLLRFMKKRVICEKLAFSAEIGTGDAALTAISVGGLWGFLYTAYAALTRYFTVKFEQPSFSVTPDYNRKLFDFQFHGIFSVRVVNIIVIGIWSSAHFLKRAVKTAVQSRAQQAEQTETVEK